MTNMFNFSESAKNLHLILTKISRLFVEQHKEDVLIDMPTMYNLLCNGLPVYMCVRSTGFDLANRFALINNKQVRNDSEFEMVRPTIVKTLGAEVYIKLFPDAPRIDIIVVSHFDNLNQIKYELLGLNGFEVNFVEKFGA